MSEKQKVEKFFVLLRSMGLDKTTVNGMLYQRRKALAKETKQNPQPAPKPKPFNSTNPEKIYKYNISFFKQLYKSKALGKLAWWGCSACGGKPDVWFKSRMVIARTVSDILPYCQKCATEQQCREEEAIGATKKPIKDSTSASLKQ